MATEASTRNNQRHAQGALGLGAVKSRVRFLLAERYALWFAVWAAVLCIVPAVLAKFRVLPIEWMHLAGFIAAGALAGWLWGYFRRLEDFDVARLTEIRMALKERLSSAVALEGQADAEPMVSALVEDAAGHLQGCEPKRLFRRRFDRRGQALVGLLVLLAAIMILPELPYFQSAATRKTRAQMKTQGEKLVRLAKELEKKQAPADKKAILAQVAENLKKLGKDMEKGRITHKKSLVELNKLDRQIAAAKEALGGKVAQKSLAKAAQDLQTSSARMRQEQAGLLQKILEQLNSGTMPDGSKLTPQQRKELEKLAEDLKEMPTEALFELDDTLANKIAEMLARQDVQEALKTIQELAEKFESSEMQGELAKLSKEELEALAEELRELAEQLKNTDLEELAQGLIELAEALKRGDLKACQGIGGRLGAIGLGMGNNLALMAALGQAQLSLFPAQKGKGVGPAFGLSKYDPNLDSEAYRGAETRIPTKHYDTRVRGTLGEKGEIQAIQILGEPDDAGSAQVPYYEVYSDYSKTAESALDREEVPAPYRTRVKDYFESLNPTATEQE